MKVNVVTKERLIERDGNTIYGVEYIPENANGKLPAVIMSHGYNSSHKDVAYTSQRLAERGMYVYAYDFCGGSTRSMSSGSSLDMSIETELCDIKNVINTVKSLDIVDSDRIYLYGESQGGFVSALAGADMTEQIAGLILIYPAFCIPDDWLKRDESEFDNPIELMGMTISKCFYNGLPRYDVYEKVSCYTNPVLIIHGDADRLVDIAYTNKLVDTYENAKLTVLKGERHGFSPDGQEKSFDEINKFLSALGV